MEALLRANGRSRAAHDALRRGARERRAASRAAPPLVEPLNPPVPDARLKARRHSSGRGCSLARAGAASQLSGGRAAATASAGSRRSACRVPPDPGRAPRRARRAGPRARAPEARAAARPGEGVNADRLLTAPEEGASPVRARRAATLLRPRAPHVNNGSVRRDKGLARRARRLPRRDVVRESRSRSAIAAQSRLWRSSRCTTAAGSPAPPPLALPILRLVDDVEEPDAAVGTSACGFPSLGCSSIQPNPFDGLGETGSRPRVARRPVRTSRRAARRARAGRGRARRRARRRAHEAACASTRRSRSR